MSQSIMMEEKTPVSAVLKRICFSEKVLIQAVIELNVGKTGYRIGRAPENDIVWNQIQVSRQHSTIELKQGWWSLKHDSSNGVMINGDPLPRNEWHLLKSGDIVNFVPVMGYSYLFSEKKEDTEHAGTSAGSGISSMFRDKKNRLRIYSSDDDSCEELKDLDENPRPGPYLLHDFNEFDDDGIGLAEFPSADASPSILQNESIQQEVLDKENFCSADEIEDDVDENSDNLGNKVNLAAYLIESSDNEKPGCSMNIIQSSLSGTEMNGKRNIDVAFEESESSGSPIKRSRVYSHEKALSICSIDPNQLMEKASQEKEDKFRAAVQNCDNIDELKEMFLKVRTRFLEKIDILKIEQSLELDDAKSTLETQKKVFEEIQQESSQTQMKSIESFFSCSICEEIYVESSIIDCGHSFCGYCINQWKSKKPECPVCRSRITQVSKHYELDSYISSVIQSMPQSVIEKRTKVIEERRLQVIDKPAPSCSKEVTRRNSRTRRGRRGRGRYNAAQY